MRGVTEVCNEASKRETMHFLLLRQVTCLHGPITKIIHDHINRPVHLTKLWSFADNGSTISVLAFMIYLCSVSTCVCSETRCSSYLLMGHSIR